MSKFTPPHPLKTAVLFLVFNRPDTTRQVFEQIRKAKPPRLYIAADGSRDNVPSEAERVKQVRDYVLSNIDWDCEVKTLFRDKNLGCKYAVSSAITWFFEHEEMGIILEDDTVPSLSFFWFCEELLERYKDDERVGMISGNNFYPIDTKYSYHFSKHGGIWGWASWKRVWKHYRISVKDSWIRCSRVIYNHFGNMHETIKWLYRLKLVKIDKLNTWDFQFAYMRFVNGYLTIRSAVNLVANIGFSEEALHTKGKPRKEFLCCKEIAFPLRHKKLENETFMNDRILEKKLNNSLNTLKTLFKLLF